MTTQENDHEIQKKMRPAQMSSRFVLPLLTIHLLEGIFPQKKVIPKDDKPTHQKKHYSPHFCTTFFSFLPILF